MDVSLTAVLAIFFLLTVSSATFFLAERLRAPYTVLLVAVGVMLVPLAHTPAFSFLNDFQFTPELLFYVFLPVLIFESGYNINIRNLVDNIRAISTLSIVSLLISALSIAAGIFFLFPFIGLDVPFIGALLFGALISATDPVAVLALFKDFGAPRRLTLIFEGESIFNDGTAVALFLVVLGIAIGGYHGPISLLEGAASFLTMVAGGIILGLVAGGLFSKAIGYAKGNEFVQITLSVALAHLTFILSDYLSQHLVIAGAHIHLSAIIATAVAAMVFGNYGRAKISPHAEEFVEKFWGQSAFFANSLVFILIGLLFADLPFSIATFGLPILVVVVVVAAARALSVYPVTALLNLFSREEPIPRGWSHVLAWGSLRGALAVTMVLLIPDSLSFTGWTHPFSPKELILALTIGCIFATLFIKATTIGRLMEHLKISELSKREKVAYAEARALISTQALARLKDFVRKGYVDERIAKTLVHTWEQNAETARADALALATGAQDRVPEQVLRLYAIGLEIVHLRDLYTYREVNEAVYKRILGKLTIQREHAEQGAFQLDPSLHRDAKDVFEHLADLVRTWVFRKKGAPSPEEQYMYYRAQLIIARKVVKELGELERAGLDGIFGAEAFANVHEVYTSFLEGSRQKLRVVSEDYAEYVPHISELLARRGLQKVGEQALESIVAKGMLTQKVHIMLRDELEREAEAQHLR